MTTLKLVNPPSLPNPEVIPRRISQDAEDILAELIIWLNDEDNTVYTGLLSERGDFTRPILPQMAIRQFLLFAGLSAEDAIRISDIEMVHPSEVVPEEKEISVATDE